MKVATNCQAARIRTLNVAARHTPNRKWYTIEEQLEYRSSEKADSQGRGDTTRGTLATKQSDGYPDTSKRNFRRRKYGGILEKLHLKQKEEDEVNPESGKSEQMFTAYSQLKYTFFSSYGKIVLYPFIPGSIRAYRYRRKSGTDTHLAGFAVQYTGKGAVTVFAVNFIAIFPTVMVLADAADQLMLRTGDNLGALINATFRSDASRESIPSWMDFTH